MSTSVTDPTTPVAQGQPEKSWISSEDVPSLGLAMIVDFAARDQTPDFRNTIKLGFDFSRFKAPSFYASFELLERAARLFGITM